MSINLASIHKSTTPPCSNPGERDHRATVPATLASAADLTPPMISCSQETREPRPTATTTLASAVGTIGYQPAEHPLHHDPNTAAPRRVESRHRLEISSKTILHNGDNNPEQKPARTGVPDPAAVFHDPDYVYQSVEYAFHQTTTDPHLKERLHSLALSLFPEEDPYTPPVSNNPPQQPQPQPSGPRYTGGHQVQR